MPGTGHGFLLWKYITLELKCLCPALYFLFTIGQEEHFKLDSLQDIEMHGLALCLLILPSTGHACKNQPTNSTAEDEGQMGAGPIPSARSVPWLPNHTLNITKGRGKTIITRLRYFLKCVGSNPYYIRNLIWEGLWKWSGREAQHKARNKQNLSDEISDIGVSHRHASK